MIYDDTNESTIENTKAWLVRCTVQLDWYNVESDDYQPIASGVCLTFQGLKIIVTADHVLSESRYKSFFVKRTKGDRGSIHLRGYYFSCMPHFDLGYFVLEPDCYNELSSYYHFITFPFLSENYVNTYGKSPLLIAGFPWRKTKKISDGFMVKFKVQMLMSSREFAYDNMAKSDCVILQRNKKVFDPKSGQKHKVIKYDGMSGCGIWMIENDLLYAEPNPNISLVGILYEGSNEHLYGIRLDVLFNSVYQFRSHANIGFEYN